MMNSNGNFRVKASALLLLAAAFSAVGAVPPIQYQFATTNKADALTNIIRVIAGGGLATNSSIPVAGTNITIQTNGFLFTINASAFPHDAIPSWVTNAGTNTSGGPIISNASITAGGMSLSPVYSLSSGTNLVISGSSLAAVNGTYTYVSSYDYTDTDSGGGGAGRVDDYVGPNGYGIEKDNADLDGIFFVKYGISSESFPYVVTNSSGALTRKVGGFNPPNCGSVFTVSGADGTATLCASTNYNYLGFDLVGKIFGDGSGFTNVIPRPTTDTQDGGFGSNYLATVQVKHSMRIAAGRVPHLGTTSGALLGNNEAQAVAWAQWLNTSGLVDAGYNTVCLDAKWALATRDANGDMQPDPALYPSGFPWLIDALKTNRCYLGLYTSEFVAEGPPSISKATAYQDGLKFASWGVRSVKCDGLNKALTGAEADTRYIIERLAQGLDDGAAFYRLEYPIYLTCVVRTNFSWLPGLVNGIYNVKTVGDANGGNGDGTDSNGAARQDVLYSFLTNAPAFTSVGTQYNPEGLGHSAEEAWWNTNYARADFGIHCMGPYTMWVFRQTDVGIPIYTNREAISINQDPMVAPGLFLSTNSNYGTNYVYQKALYRPLENGDIALGLWNLNTNAKGMFSVSLATIPGLATNTAWVSDVFDRTNGYCSGTLTAIVNTNGFNLYRISRECTTLVAGSGVISQTNWPASSITNAPWQYGSSNLTNWGQLATNVLSVQTGWTNGSAYADYMVAATNVPTPQEGRVFWDATQHTLAYYSDRTNVTVNIAQEEHVRVYNSYGYTITNGAVMTLSGSHGQLPVAVFARSTTNIMAAGADIIGVVTEDIPSHEEGLITINGVVHGLNTHAFDPGYTLYVSTNAGAYTTNPPANQYSAALVGVLLTSHPNDGSILVAPKQATGIGDVTGFYSYVSNAVAGVTLPTGVLTNNQSGVTLSGAFEGSGYGLSNVFSPTGFRSVSGFPIANMTSDSPQEYSVTWNTIAFSATNVGLSGEFSGTFTGNAAGLTNLQAASLTGLAPTGVVATIPAAGDGWILSSSNGVRNWSRNGGMLTNLQVDAGVSLSGTNVWTGTNTFSKQVLFSTGIGQTNLIVGPPDTNFAIVAGTPNQTTTTIAGRSLTLRASSAVAGSSVAGAAMGGSVTISAGNSDRLTSGNISGAPVNIYGGNAIGDAGVGGAVNIVGGAGSGGGGVNSKGGTVTIKGGVDAVSGGGAPSGDVILQTQVGFGTAVTIGEIKLIGASQTGTTYASPAQTGGAISIYPGAGAATATTTDGARGGTGGPFTVTGGAGGNSPGTGGTGGTGSTLTFNSGPGGNETGASGTRVGGDSGNIIFNIGTNGTGATANGSLGTIQFHVPTATNQMTIGGSGVGITTLSAGTITATNGYTLQAAVTNGTISCTTNKQVYMLNGTNQIATLVNAANVVGVVHTFTSTNQSGSFILTNATGGQTIGNGQFLSYTNLGAGSVAFISDGAHWYYANGHGRIGIDDINFPITTLNPSGSEISGTLVSTSGQSGTQMALRMAALSTFFATPQMKHEWIKGTTVYPHIHIETQTANANTVEWRISYSVADIDGTFPADTVVTNTTSIPAGGQWKHLLYNLPTNGIPMSTNGHSANIRLKYSVISQTETLDIVNFDVHYLYQTQ